MYTALRWTGYVYSPLTKMRRRKRTSYCARSCRKTARRQDETKQQRSQKLGVVASRSRRQAETKQQRTAAAVVATMTRSRCKGETEQQVLVGQAANSPRNCADTGTNPVQTRATFQSESKDCLLYTSPSPRDGLLSRMPSSA